eukprot:TRINITY_DN735_c0_g5_i2.p1 TRINITY_DN735_c0_g5~~TRINITY_DN735_c0_g5_i2.p1  ORF type:complete len:199 (+),score=63.21 TRINITY_DN735_c0_g5_i2:142-738(+)
MSTFDFPTKWYGEIGDQTVYMVYGMDIPEGTLAISHQFAEENKDALFPVVDNIEGSWGMVGIGEGYKMTGYGYAHGLVQYNEGETFAATFVVLLKELTENADTIFNADEGKISVRLMPMNDDIEDGYSLASLEFAENNSKTISTFIRETFGSAVPIKLDDVGWFDSKGTHEVDAPPLMAKLVIKTLEEAKDEDADKFW